MPQKILTNSKEEILVIGSVFGEKSLLQAFPANFKSFFRTTLYAKLAVSDGEY